MCEKTQFKYCPSTIDKCMRERIRSMRDQGINTLGCCCGHNIYPMTIIVKSKDGIITEYFSDKIIPRKRRFYKKDKKGYYFIPEIMEEKNECKTINGKIKYV